MPEFKVFLLMKSKVGQYSIFQYTRNTIEDAQSVAQEASKRLIGRQFEANSGTCVGVYIIDMETGRYMSPIYGQPPT